MSVVCARQGCGSTFAPEANAEASCSFHPGAPDFHEGLKGWSCCKDINKPVMEFDQFMQIPGCTKSTHLAKEDKPKAASKPTAPAPSAAAPSSVSKSGVETYGAPAPALPAASTTLAAANTAVAASASAAPPTPAFVEEVDDEAAPLPSGGACKRTSCKYRLDAAEPAAREQQPDCLYHPGAPIFREGSKGYTCCKRRVLDFDDFLKMEGCRTADSGHLFVGQKKESSAKEVVAARIDHYQTPALIHMSVFAKKVDAASSSITFTRDSVILDLNLPTSKVERTVNLYAPIDPASSSFKVLGTKVDLTLVKENGASWPVLERLADGVELPKGYALTFAPQRH